MYEFIEKTALNITIISNYTRWVISHVWNTNTENSAMAPLDRLNNSQIFIIHF